MNMNEFKTFKTFNRFAPLKPFWTVSTIQPPVLRLPRARGGGIRWVERLERLERFEPEMRVMSDAF